MKLVYTEKEKETATKIGFEITKMLREVSFHESRLILDTLELAYPWGGLEMELRKGEFIDLEDDAA